MDERSRSSWRSQPAIPANSGGLFRYMCFFACICFTRFSVRIYILIWHGLAKLKLTCMSFQFYQMLQREQFMMLDCLASSLMMTTKWVSANFVYSLCTQFFFFWWISTELRLCCAIVESRSFVISCKKWLWWWKVWAHRLYIKRPEPTTCYASFYTNKCTNCMINLEFVFVGGIHFGASSRIVNGHDCEWTKNRIWICRRLWFSLSIR